MENLIGDLDPDYIIAFNAGAIWNIITLWVKRGMKDSPEQIRDTIEQYLGRMKPVPVDHYGRRD